MGVVVMNSQRGTHMGWKVGGLAIALAISTRVGLAFQGDPASMPENIASSLHGADEAEELLPERVSASAMKVAGVGAEVLGVIHDMEAAIRAGNAEKYLECVDLSDPVFATEQRNWAKDLAKKPPSAFEIVLVDPSASPDDAGEHKAAPGSEGKETAKPNDAANADENANEWTQTIEMKWSQPADEAGSTAAFNRKVTIGAKFRKVAAGAGRGGALAMKYAGEAWKRVETDHVIVYFDEGLEEVADAAVATFEKIRPRVLEGFELANAPKDSKQVIKLYTRMSHLQQSIYLSYPHPLGGWNEPGESIKILANKRTGEASLRGLLSHEFGHVCTFALGDKANDMPWWVLEGVAELSTTPFDSKAIMRAKQTVQRWAKNDNLKAWKNLADFNIVPPDLHGHVYTQGLHMVWYVSDKFGRDARVKWLTSMATGKSLDVASREVLNMSFDELDREWRASVMQASVNDEKPERDE